MQGVASREYSFVETSVGAKPTLACIGNAGVVGASSWLDAVFMAVLQDKGPASQGHRELVLVKSRRLLAITPSSFMGFVLRIAPCSSKGW